MNWLTPLNNSTTQQLNNYDTENNHLYIAPAGGIMRRRATEI
jgi:hypothetical protein